MIALVRLSERKPTESEVGLFGEIAAVALLRENTECTFRDLSPDEVERIIESGQAEHWFWVSGVKQAILAEYTANN